MTATLAITVLGLDRPGIIAEVTAQLADLGGNLQDSSMTLLRGHFAWTLLVAVDAGPADVQARLARLTDEGLVVSVLVLPEQSPGGVDGTEWLLSVHGGDRPGIVSGLTAPIAEAGGNITDLTTRLGAGLYILVAEVSLPGDVDVTALTSRIAEVSAQLGVRATLHPAETDVL